MTNKELQEELKKYPDDFIFKVITDKGVGSIILLHNNHGDSFIYEKDIVFEITEEEV